MEKYECWLSILGWDFRLSRIVIFPYHFKTNGMLFPDKSFCFFEINAWPLPPKNFFILTLKIKPVEEWKDTAVYCQYYTVPWLYIHPLVYITKTNFSAIFYHENWSFKFPIVSFFVKKNDSCLFQVCSTESTIFLYRKSIMVICTYSVHITMGIFLQYFWAKIIGQLLKWLISCAKRYLLLVEVSISVLEEYFTQKMFDWYIVVERPCKHIGWDSRYLEDSSFRIILKRTECFSLTNLFAFLR